jgi:hypothetical protein
VSGLNLANIADSCKAGKPSTGSQEIFPFDSFPLRYGLSGNRTYEVGKELWSDTRSKIFFRAQDSHIGA